MAHATFLGCSAIDRRARNGPGPGVEVVLTGPPDEPRWGKAHDEQQRAGRGRGDPVNQPQGPFEWPGNDPFARPAAAQPEATSTYGFGSGTGVFGAPGGVEVGRPPVVWLAAGIAVATVAIAIAVLFGGTPSWAVVAWVAAGPVAVGLLAVHALRDTQQRARPLYAAPSWIRLLYGGVMLLAVVGIVISSVRFALWVGRL